MPQKCWYWDERPLMTALGDPMTILGEVLVLPTDL